MAILRVYDGLIDLLAAVARPHRLVSFRLSSPARARMAELIAREELGWLRPAEARELDLYLELDQAFTQLRARARLQLLLVRAA